MTQFSIFIFYFIGVLVTIAYRSTFELWPNLVKSLLWPVFLVRWFINHLIPD